MPNLLADLTFTDQHSASVSKLVSRIAADSGLAPPLVYQSPVQLLTWIHDHSYAICKSVADRRVPDRRGHSGFMLWMTAYDEYCTFLSVETSKIEDSVLAYNGKGDSTC